MAGDIISELTELTSVSDTDILPIVSGGVTQKVQKTNLVSAERTRLDNLETDVTNLEIVVNNASASAPASVILAEDTDNGTNKITITAPSAVASDKILTLPDETGTLLTQESDYYGMARQAIMNGNFDVWQRGTSAALADVTVAFQADRWLDYVDKNGGTLPTLTRSRQLLTSGDITGAFYFSRLATNGAGTSLGVNSLGVMQQRIEDGTSKLCGLNKKVTLSFWAKSDIANKRICPTIVQNYGSGGSQTAQETILGTPITLTSTWTKYTATFTTNTLVGKTFGTTTTGYIELNMWYMWGTTYGNANVQTSVTAETFVGAGNIDIAQVQLCSGDVALPFQPKSYEEELRACHRYYDTGIFRNFSTLAYIGGTVKFSNAMRIMNVTYTDLVGNASKISTNAANNLSVTGGGVVGTTVGVNEGFCIDAAISGTAGTWTGITWINNAEI
jgi:hypothetical protein